MTTTFGLHQIVNTSATINTYGGIRTSITASERSLNPYLRVVFGLIQITDCNFFCGWTGYGATIGNTGGGGGDMYPNNSAIGLKLEANNANFQLYHNDGNSPGTTETTPIAPADVDTLHTFELRGIDSVPKYQYKFDHAASWTDITTDIPSSTVELYIQIWQENTVATNKQFRLVDVLTRIDNRG